MEKRKILVTCALPYANGPIHLGHMVEHIQTDIWVRFQKMRGHDCHFVCADDAHGTPIMLRAKQEGITPEQLINQSSADHQRDFSGFNIEYDNYYSTHSDENKALSEMIYNQSKAHGCISQKVIKQAYDEEAKMFLPDRFIKGSCPNCKSADQYGDNCEVCGKTYNTTDLIDPYSVVSGSKPIEKDTEHYFFELSQFTEFLEQWLASADLQTEVINKLREWIDQGLADWDISRDAPYWGFKIPGTDDKYFYVWLDAPVGYLASFKHLCDNNQLNFDDYWREDSNAEVYHFIGKDIAYFHILFWPAMLKAAQMRRPTGVFCHGFLTVNGQKMSKSRGTFIQAKTYLEHLPAEPLRYYFASKLNASIDDLDLNLEDMVKKTNVDLVGKLVNIASRCAGFIHKRNHGRLADHMDDQALYQKITDAEAEVAEAYEQRQYNKAIRIIMSLADSANQYIDEQAPWVLAKQEGQEDKVHAVCSQGINMYRALIIMLKPVVPQLAARSEAFLNHGDLLWSGIHAPLFCTEITAFKALLARLDPKAVEQLIEANIAAVKAEQDMLKGGAENKADNSNQANEDDGMIEFDQFAQVDLRIATIEDAQHIEGADKLLQLTLNVGELGKKNVFAGIKAYYAPEDLIGKQTLMVANLQPRKMRFGVSEGMVLAAGDGKGLFLLSPDQGATAGMKVK